MRGWRSVVMVAGVVMALVPVGASAGSLPDPDAGDTILGTVGGVRYAKESAAFAGIGAFADATAGCGGGSRHLVGGGGSSSGAPADTWQASQILRDHDDADLRPDDGIEAAGYGMPGGQVTAWSICMTDAPTRYVVAGVPAQPSGLRSRTAVCGAAKWHATAGFVFMATSGSWIGSSNPGDGPDADTTPDDSWRGTAFDTAGGLGAMFVSVVCISGRTLHYVKGPSGIVPAGGSLTRKATCAAADHVVGGGVRVAGSVDDARMVVSAPFDGTDAGTIPDDGWKATVHNVSAGPRSITPWAVCLH